LFVEGKMMQLFSTFLFLVTFIGSKTSAANIQQLNVNNFEHLTQASTGATTGSWFVKFYAPWCRHCQKLAPVFSELAEYLESDENLSSDGPSRNVVLGEVDCTQDKFLCKEFGVEEYPALIMFHLGNMITYPTDQPDKFARHYDHLLKFVQGGFLSDNMGNYTKPVPVQENPFMMAINSIKGIFRAFWKQYIAMIIFIVILGKIIDLGERSLTPKRVPQNKKNK